MSPHRWRIFLLSLLPALLLLGCSIPGLEPPQANNGPSVVISSPVNNQELPLNSEATIQSVSIDPSGVIQRVELLIDDQVIWIDANAQPIEGEPFIVLQPWTPTTPGSHVLRVVAYNADNAAGESEPLTVLVVDEAEVAASTQQTATTTISVAESTATTETGEANESEAGETATPDENQDSLELVPAESATPPPVDSAETPAAPVPTPSSTPPPQTFEPTGLEPEGRFKDIWIALEAGESRLGYPTVPVIGGRNYAQQRFAGGLMFWWDNPETPDYIWVIDSPAEDLRSGQTSNLYPDLWEGGSTEYSCEAAVPNGPVRGFGKVWCEHPELIERLGFPVEPERGSGGMPPFAQVQPFQGGVMIYNPISQEVYVLFEQGDWRRFDY